MKRTLLVLITILAVVPVFAQDPDLGFPPFGSFQNGQFDSVNRSNLNTNFSIPIASFPGRGRDFSLRLTYNSLVWREFASTWQSVADASGQPDWGWKINSPIGEIHFKIDSGECPTGQIDPETSLEILSPYEKYYDYVYVDPNGTWHRFPTVVVHVETDPGIFPAGFPPCNPPLPENITTGIADDESGFSIDIADPEDPVVRAGNGTIVTKNTLTDRNGNIISRTFDPITGTTEWTDTLGRIVVRVIESATSVQYQVLDKNGTYQTTLLTLTTFGVRTKFNCPGIVEYNNTGTLPTALLFPNGEKFNFTYEDTPSTADKKTARLSKVRLPNGGTYEYAYSGSHAGMNCNDATAIELTRTITSLGQAAVWGYARAQVAGNDWRTTITAPQLPYDTAANQSTYKFLGVARVGVTKIYQGSATGTPLREIQQSWSLTSGVPSIRTTILPGGETSSVYTIYDDYGNLLQTTEKDWGYLTPGPAIRTVVNTYETAEAYANLNIRNLITSSAVWEGSSGSGTLISFTEHEYDDYATNPMTVVSGAAQHDDAGHGAAFETRGNLTAVTVYEDAATLAGPNTRILEYDTLGNVISAGMGCCQERTWDYTATTEYAYPETVTSGPSGGPQLTQSVTYNFHTGLVETATDENNKTTTFGYDIYSRTVQVTRPDDEQVTVNYDDVANKVTTTIPIQGSDRRRRIQYFDDLGRGYRGCMEDGSGGNSSCSEAVFDPIGRVLKSSNPFDGGGSPAYWTERRFDAMGRPTVLIPPDGTATLNNSSYSYSGNATTVTGPTGKQRRSYTDAAGRLIQVDEPGGPGGATAGTGSATVSGSEQSQPQAATPATGSVTISGSLQTNVTTICRTIMGEEVCFDSTIYDSGTAWITVNGFTKTVSYGQGSYSTSIASALAAAFNDDPASPVTATSSSSTVDLTTKTVGSGTNYPLSAGTTYDVSRFTSPSFTATPSGSTLTGGAEAGTAYDSGTVWVKVDAFTATASYGEGSTASGIASSLRTTLNGASSPVTAGGTGTLITLTSKATGASSNYSLTVGQTYDSANFASPSFTASSSGATLTGGGDNVAPLDDNTLITTYTYSGLDQLIRAYTLDAGGATEQERLYNYDGRGLLTSQTTPEAGTVDYLYNDDGLLIQSTDKRDVVETLTYDSLNRLRGVASDTSADPNVATMPNICDPFDPMGTASHHTCYYYGTNPASNNNGRLTQVINPTVDESYFYDILGRVTQMEREIDGVSYTLDYAFNLAGELTSITYPSGRIVDQDYDALGRLEAIREGATNYASGFDYSNPAQQVEGFTYGNGVVADFTYTPARLQLDTIKYTEGSTKLLDLDYCYRLFVPSTGTCIAIGGNGGQITGIIDSTGTEEAGRTVGYSYDSLGRLAAAETKGSATFAKWKYEYTYDRYGNREAQTLTEGSGNPIFLSFDPGKNQITNALYDYDASGNLEAEPDGVGGTRTYKYDAEGRIVEVNGGTTATYAYDGAGIRVRKDAGGVAIVSIYSGTKVIAEYNSGVAATSPNTEYIYLGSQLLTTIDTSVSPEAINYHHADHLSTRVSTDSSGTVTAEQGHLPFGDGWYSSGAGSKWGFTTYESDIESGLDYAMFRYDNTRLGRFMTPDPLAGSTGSPQSLNRYAYTRNDPVNLVDPLGLEIQEEWHCWDGLDWHTLYDMDGDGKPDGEYLPGQCHQHLPGDGGPESGPTGVIDDDDDGGGTDCDQKILDMLNKKLKTNLTKNDIVDRPPINTTGNTQNIVVETTSLSIDTFNSIHPDQRFSSGRARLGPSLHIPDEEFSKTNVGLVRTVRFRAHLDSANPTNFFPFPLVGTLKHAILDVWTDKGGPCP